MWLSSLRCQRDPMCSNLGLLLQAQGDLEGARWELEQALAIEQAALGPDHPEAAIARDNLGSLLQDLRDRE